LLSNLLNIYYLLSSMVCISCNVLSYMWSNVRTPGICFILFIFTLLFIRMYC
jgi:hypothetical protein